MAKKIDITNFDTEVLNSDKKVVVDFYADWCGPCKLMAPIIEDLSNELTDVKFCKLNVDDDPELANEFEVFSIPTLIVFENGNVKDRHTGYMPKDSVSQFITKG